MADSTAYLEPSPYVVDEGPVLYAVQVQAADRPIKVGITSNLRLRLSALQTAIPWGLQIIGTRPGSYVEERAIHSRLSMYRIKSEWYGAKALDTIKEILSPDWPTPLPLTDNHPTLPGRRIDGSFLPNHLVSGSYKGIYWNKGKKKWDCYLKINGTPTYVGSCDTYTRAVEFRSESADHPNFRMGRNPFHAKAKDGADD